MIPRLHHSVCSSDHSTLAPEDRHDRLVCVGSCFAPELADLPTILLICFARCRRMPRIGQAYCTVVESLKSMLRISLATLPPCPHSSRARGDRKTDLRSSILRVGYSRLRRKRSPTIVYSPLFVLLISESKLAGSSRAVTKSARAPLTLAHNKLIGCDLSDYLIGPRQHVGR